MLVKTPLVRLELTHELVSTEQFQVVDDVVLRLAQPSRIGQEDISVRGVFWCLRYETRKR